jgi:mannose-6-phosphate isomerase-like protein (cupin superfamily)
MFIEKPIIEEKPWGTMKRFLFNQKGTIQLLNIQKGEKLSLHYHNKRDDTWYVISGMINVVLNEETFVLRKGDSIKIPKGSKHDASALTDDTNILEIAVDEFDVLDTIRLTDKYGRE